MGDLRSELGRVIGELGFSKWGIGDIAGLHPLADEFPKALSVALAFKPAFETYDEEAYNKQSAQVREQTEAKVDELLTFFQHNNINHTIPKGMQNVETLHSEFPYKLAATRAGLGWIGRSDLLVTPEFGPRVRLGTILFDAEVAVDAPVTASGCSECNACVRSCPAQVIHNALWRPGLERDELMSAVECNRYRDIGLPTLGRKHSCGLCLLACPQGKS